MFLQRLPLLRIRELILLMNLIHVVHFQLPQIHQIVWKTCWVHCWSRLLLMHPLSFHLLLQLYPMKLLPLHTLVLVQHEATAPVVNQAFEDPFGDTPFKATPSWESGIATNF